MQQRTKEFLTHKPDSDLQEICDFLYWEHDLEISRSTVSRHLKAIRWSNKKMRLIAAQRNEDLRESWIEDLQQYRPDQLVYLDESGCDKRDGARRYGWAPLGSTLEMRSRLERGQRYHLLPALAIDGLLDAFVYPGQSSLDGFVVWIRDRVLPKCTRFPGPRSVLILDNASWHHCQQLKDLCDAAGVLLIYLPPYSPDLNPIEAFFKDFKALLKKTYREKYGDSNSCEEFMAFLEGTAWAVSARRKAIRGHFCAARVNFEGSCG